VALPPYPLPATLLPPLPYRYHFTIAEMNKFLYYVVVSRRTGTCSLMLLLVSLPSTGLVLGGRWIVVPACRQLRALRVSRRVEAVPRAYQHVALPLTVHPRDGIPLPCGVSLRTLPAKCSGVPRAEYPSMTAPPMVSGRTVRRLAHYGRTRSDVAADAISDVQRCGAPCISLVLHAFSVLAPACCLLSPHRHFLLASRTLSSCLCPASFLVLPAALLRWPPELYACFAVSQSIASLAHWFSGTRQRARAVPPGQARRRYSFSPLSRFNKRSLPVRREGRRLLLQHARAHAHDATNARPPAALPAAGASVWFLPTLTLRRRPRLGVPMSW